MVNLFTENTFSEVLVGLESLGYYRDSSLLEENYGFPDYFTRPNENRIIPGAVFGQTPTSYETATIGVAISNGFREKSLINQLRSLGAPFILEVDKYEIREWAVSREENGHELVEKYPVESLKQMFVARANDWKPKSLLRAKISVNFIEDYNSVYSLDYFLN